MAQRPPAWRPLLAPLQHSMGDGSARDLISALGWITLLLLAWLLAPYGFVVLPTLFAVTTFGSVMALGLMMRLIDAAEHAETIGAALSHGSLNIGNALGAWVGGATIAAGYGYRSPLAVGVVMSLAGVGVLAVGFALDRSPVAAREARMPAGSSIRVSRPGRPDSTSTPCSSEKASQVPKTPCSFSHTTFPVASS